MAVEVKGKLTLQDDTSGTLGKIRKGFEQTHAAQQQVQGAMGFIKTAGAMAVGSAIVPMIRKVGEIASGFVHAARESMAFQRGISSLVASVQGVSFERAQAEALRLDETIERIGIDAGVKMDLIEPAFSRMLEIQGATEEGIRRSIDVTKSLATITYNLGTDMGITSMEVSMMSEGILRTRGRMFQLLQATGIFGEKSKGAAQYWAKLTEEERVKRLNAALSQIAGKMGQQQLGFSGYVASIHNLIDIAKKEIGTPIARALTPFAKEFRDGLRELMPSIQEFGAMAARDIAGGLKEASQWMKDAVRYVIDHRAEIEEGFRRGAEHIKGAVAFVVGHRNLIAGAIGLYYGVPMAKRAWAAAAEYGPAVAGGVAGAGRGLMAGGRALAATTMMGPAAGGFGAIIPAMAGAAGAAGALTLAIGGLGVALWQGAKLYAEVKGNQAADNVARRKAIDEFIAKGGMFVKATETMERDLAHMTNQFVMTSETIGMTRKQAQGLVDEYWKTFDASQKIVKAMEDSTRAIESLSAPVTAEEMKYRAITVRQDMEQVGQLFQQAAGAHNQAAMNYIGNILSGSVAMQQAFLQSGKMSAEAYDQLANIVAGKSQEFAEKLLKLATGQTPGARPNFNVNMSGGQVFNVKQDFKDVDPDRQLIVFKRDMASMATRRLQSHYATPFGA